MVLNRGVDGMNIDSRRSTEHANMEKGYQLNCINRVMNMWIMVGILLLLPTSGQALNKTIFIFANGGRVAKWNGSAVSHYLNNQIKSTSLLVDGMGNVKGRQEYLPFGGDMTNRGAIGDYRYTGKQLDASTGLYYFGARYYEPGIGRFLALDPVSESYPSISPFSYTANNPLRFVDPDGRILRDQNGKIIYRPSGSPVTVRHPSDSDNPVEVQAGHIYADDGTKLEAFQNLSDDVRFDTDCHGVTFADAEYWINNGEAMKILSGDHYQQQENPQIGDVAVYFDEKGNVVHSATVIQIGEQPDNVVVEGLGGLEVTSHQDRVKEAWTAPGTVVSYYRKSRDQAENEKKSKTTEEERRDEQTDPVK